MADWRAPLMSAVCYQDPKAALAWLEKAFGFEISMLIEDGQGGIAHSEMRFGNAVVMVGNEWSADHTSPLSIGGKNTQTVHIQLTTDVDAHCERARGGGRRNPDGAGDPVLRRPHLSLSRPGGPHLDGRPDRRDRDPRTGRGGQRAEDHGVGVTARAAARAAPAELDRTLAALADPNRRRVVDLLSHGPRAAGDLARELDLTPPAMSRHLKTLRQSGLVEESHPTFDARVRIYALRPEPWFICCAGLRTPNGSGASSSPPSRPTSSGTHDLQGLCGPCG